MTRVLALADQSKIGCITQRRFAKVGTKTHPQRGADLDRNGLAGSPETARRFEPKSPVGNSEICNITYMMIADEDAALFGGAHRGLTFLKPAVDQQGRYRTPSPNIGASIEGIAHNIADQALRGNLPDQPRSLNGVGRQLHVVITEPLECLTHAPPFSKLGEHQLNRFADPSIGMKHNLTHGVSGKIGRAH